MTTIKLILRRTLVCFLTFMGCTLVYFATFMGVATIMLPEGPYRWLGHHVDLLLDASAALAVCAAIWVTMKGEEDDSPARHAGGSTPLSASTAPRGKSATPF